MLIILCIAHSVCYDARKHGGLDMAVAEVKTKKTRASVDKFIDAVEDPQARSDSKTILKLMGDASGEKPAMWGTSMVGFGIWHYKSPATGREGDWPRGGFSPRKQNLTLYVLSGKKEEAPLLKKLGKHSTGKSCLYIKRLTDVDMNVLKQLIKLPFTPEK